MIEIGGQAFPSIAEVRSHVHNLLNNSPMDEPLSETDNDIIQELFLCHPDADEKIGDKEIQFFKVGQHKEAGARAFCIVRSDDSEETFSIKKCVSAWTRTQTEKTGTSAKSAARKQPKPQQQVVGTLDINQVPDAEGLAGLVIHFQRVVDLHAQLGKEIEQIQKILAEEAKR